MQFNEFNNTSQGVFIDPAGNFLAINQTSGGIDFNQTGSGSRACHPGFARYRPIGYRSFTHSQKNLISNSANHDIAPLARQAGLFLVGKKSERVRFTKM